jgi:general secretion pathway protein L
MARLLGIDIRASHVRAALLQTSYRHVVIEQLREVSLAEVQPIERALQAAVVPLLQQTELAIAVEGASSFIHRISLPATAQKRLAEVLPFELEAQIPVDISELVFDHRTLRRSSPAAPLVVLTAAARLEQVRERLELVGRALGRQPDRVGCGPLPLASLCSICPSLAVPGPIALVDLGGRRTEVLILVGGEPVFARTLSRGVEGLPGSAAPLAAELRQTFTAYAAQGSETPVQIAYLLGGGASAAGAEAYLAQELDVPVTQLPSLDAQVSPADAEHVPRFAKAIALAVGLSGRTRDLDLRRGPLAYQRGFAFLKDKTPVLAGLIGAVAVSFAFSSWARYRALEREAEALQTRLTGLAQVVLRQSVADADDAMMALERAKRREEADPMPRLDGFDVMVEISKAIPTSVTHDIEELDMQREHVRMHGVAGTTAEAQLILANLQKHECFSEAKITKISQAVNSDRQKYVLEFDVACPDDKAAQKKKKKKPEEGGSSEP